MSEAMTPRVGDRLWLAVLSFDGVTWQRAPGRLRRADAIADLRSMLLAAGWHGERCWCVLEVHALLSATKTGGWYIPLATADGRGTVEQEIDPLDAILQPIEEQWPRPEIAAAVSRPASSEFSRSAGRLAVS